MAYNKDQIIREEIMKIHGFDVNDYALNQRAINYLIPGQQSIKCTECEKSVKKIGLRDHMRDKHQKI